MPNRHLEKIAAVQLLESVRAAAAHLSQYKIEMAGHGGIATESETLHLYAHVRRLRDYLRRCVGAFPQTVEIDITERDANLLASCVVYHLTELSSRLGRSEGMDAAGDAWTAQCVRIQTDLAVELSTTRLRFLPGIRESGMKGMPPSVREVMDRVREKISSRAPEGGDGLDQFTARCGERGVNLGWRQIEFSPQTAVTEAVDDGGNEEAPQREAVSSETGSEPEQVPVGLCLDSKLVRDPRLRTMLQLYTGAYHRARLSDDFRFAAVNLGSMLECVVLDHALPRASELGLRGGPDLWNLRVVVAGILGDGFGDSEQSLFALLMAARSIIVPARQLQSPVVVTAVLLEQCERFAERLFGAVGCVASAG